MKLNQDMLFRWGVAIAGAAITIAVLVFTPLATFMGYVGGFWVGMCVALLGSREG